MRGVMFGITHSYWDWGLMLKKAPEISPPEPKTHYVDIPGMNGRMDLSEALAGKVTYGNREIKLEFSMTADRESWSAVYSEILNELHGQQKEITLDDDPMHYYKGRVTVGQPTWDRKTVSLEMTVEAEPFKRNIDGEAVL